MFRLAALCMFALGLFAASEVEAQPIALKLSFFTSDRSSVYQCQIKPFVDAVNDEGRGQVKIDVYFSGAISSTLSKQPQLVRDGLADLAIVVPGYIPDQFPDTPVLALPGLFHDAAEASRAFTWLTEKGALEGYKDFFVVGAFVSAGETLHSRTPIGSLAALKGQTIRVNNDIEGDTMRRFGAVPRLLPINQTMNALGRGKIDGVAAPPAMLVEFGFSRLTSHHYMLHIGGVPTALVMNRDKLASLPPSVQAIIRKFSGEWLSSHATDCFEARNRAVVAELKSDPRRQVVDPSPADLAAAHRVFASQIENWAKQSPQHRALVERVRSGIGKSIEVR